MLKEPKKVVVYESYLASGDILLKCPGCNELISYCRVREMMLCTQCGADLIVSEELNKQIELAMRNMSKDEVDPLTAFIRRGMMEDPKQVLKHLKEIIDSITQISSLRLLNVSSPEMNILKMNAYDKISGVVIQYHVEKKQEETIKGLDIEEEKKKCAAEHRLRSGLSEKDRKELETVLENDDLHYVFTAYSDFEDIKDEKFHELRKAYVVAAVELEEYIKGKKQGS